MMCPRVRSALDQLEYPVYTVLEEDFPKVDVALLVQDAIVSLAHTQDLGE